MTINLDDLAKAVESFEKMNGLRATAIRMSQEALKQSFNEISQDPRFKGLVCSIDKNVVYQCVVEHPLIPVVIEFKP